LKTVNSRDYEGFLNCLIEARKSASVTQQELAKLVGKPQSFVSKYERRKRRIDVVEFVSLCSVLNADPCEILRRANLWPRGAGRKPRTKSAAR
jgi:transcriptional regulator with XRE-family HTH domain